MAIEVICPQCGRRYSVPESRAGQSGRCQCGEVFRVPEPEAEAEVDFDFGSPVEEPSTWGEGQSVPFGGVEPPPRPPVEGHGPRHPTTPEELQRMCEQTELRYVVTESGACVFRFRAEHKPDPLYVVAKMSKNGKWVAVYGTVLEAVQHPRKPLMRRLMELNENLWQGKFSIAESGNIDFQFECPADTLDVQELTECIHACARVIDENYEELAGLAF